VSDGKIFLRPFSVHFKRGAGRVPLVDLHPMGPNLNLTLRRSKFAQDDMWKAACRTPKG
jgi:ribosome production factor 2